MYIGLQYIKRSLSNLEPFHGFFGLSFLVFKQQALPIGATTNIPINRLEDEFLRTYYQPEQRSNLFFRVFRGIGNKKQYWLKHDYASSGSQRTRTGTFSAAFLHPKGSDEWGWSPDYVAFLQKQLGSNNRLPAFDLAVWLYREKDWSKDTLPSDVRDRFLDEFNISDSEKISLFDLSVPKIQVQDEWLVASPIAWLEIANDMEIPPPPDLPEDEGGMLSSLSLRGVGPSRKIDIHFGQRVNLFTGDNGLGKSFILECAWWALSGNWPGFPAYPRHDAKRSEPSIHFEVSGSSGRQHRGISTYDWELQEWTSQRERPSIPGLLIYARVDGAFAVWDPSRENRSNSSGALLKSPLVFTRSDVWDGLRDTSSGKTTFLSNGLITDWINWQNSPKEEPFNTLKKVLLRLSPPGVEYGDLGRLEPGNPQRLPRDSRLIPTIKHSYGQVPVTYASAGVQRILGLAYLIVWAWEEHKTQSQLIRKLPQKRMVIVIDEIEAHLHPQWQRTILPALLDVWKDLSNDLQIQFLVATHSPLVMASMEPYFDEGKDTIFHLDLERNDLFDSEVVLEEYDFVKYGSVDSWLRSDIFELAHARSMEAERALDDARRLQESEDVTQEQVRSVSDRLVKYLAANDSFWSRWLHFASRHGVEL